LGRGAGSETYALREYLKGDPPTKIHWKATARHGRLVTREETWGQAQGEAGVGENGCGELDDGASDGNHGEGDARQNPRGHREARNRNDADIPRRGGGNRNREDQGQERFLHMYRIARTGLNPYENDQRGRLI
jgi:hypothetical protein